MMTTCLIFDRRRDASAAPRAGAAGSVVFVALLTAFVAACGSSGHASAQSNCATRAGASFATDTGSARATGRVIDIEARDYDFHPTCIVDVPVGAITLVVHNVGSQRHNVSIASQGIDRDVAPGATVSFAIRMPRVPLLFVCKYHRGLGMAGALYPATGSAS